MKTIVAILFLAQSPGPLMQGILARYQTVKMNLIESAEAMPEEAYSFRLTPPQRTFAEWIEHNIAMNNGTCASLAGKPAPTSVHGATGKAALVKALKDSFEFCDAAFKGMTDQKALTEVSQGERKVLPANTMIGLLNSWNEHYGNLVGYLRSKGVTPPSTARAQKKK